MKLTPFTLATLAALAGCATPSGVPGQPLGTADLFLATGAPAGSARLMADGQGVSLSITVSGISPGPHGFHLHTAGQCAAPDFQSAGGHLNPTGESHGLMNADGQHLGDLPNLLAAPDGSANKTVRLTGDPDYLVEQIFDGDGTAIIIHAGPDDGVSDPAGNAGPRVACGIIKRS